MKIYTGSTMGERLDKIIALNMGIMISSIPLATPKKEYNKTYCALDNGAFSCYKKGYPFMQDVFLHMLSSTYRKGIALDFIVCPDIVAGGLQSLAFSKEWANGILKTAPNLALVVQDGMRTTDLGDISAFSHIFIGGTVEWKWKHAEDWVNFAHDNNKRCHIGQCGKIEYLYKAHLLGADSVDSTSFTVNDSFYIVENFYKMVSQVHTDTLFF